MQIKVGRALKSENRKYLRRRETNVRFEVVNEIAVRK